MDLLKINHHFKAGADSGFCQGEWRGIKCLTPTSIDPVGASEIGSMCPLTPGVFQSSKPQPASVNG